MLLCAELHINVICSLTPSPAPTVASEGSSNMYAEMVPPLLLGGRVGIVGEGLQINESLHIENRNQAWPSCATGKPRVC